MAMIPDPKGEEMSTLGSQLDTGAPRRRAPRIARDDVFRAADELLVQGDRPTIDRVRMRLGRGSPNTINDHLDAWWARLGARLRDLPGQEFPQLPERASKTLQLLWTEALDEAHASLRIFLEERTTALTEREAALQARERFIDRDQALAGERNRALEDALALAREQLLAANRRAETLEGALRSMEEELMRLRGQHERLECESRDLRRQQADMRAEFESERTRMNTRHEASEAHWMAEVDRARQQEKLLEGKLAQSNAARDNPPQELQTLKRELVAGRTAVARRPKPQKTAVTVVPKPKRSLKSIKARR
jgi:hypothetical protein